jgi:hypothetical protein
MYFQWFVPEGTWARPNTWANISDFIAQMVPRWADQYSA